ncbi:MAG: cytochrome-c oxidase, cbb3-type subunit II [Rhodocyclaceae bacterium]|nr:cytochrome-c oxidase, cbb3-type subunit II [Rhodocyclaceae bacterium]MBP6110204.1 cytochrome-c oxidase, cbb3-type subunit II [Rhodocyclaceae bacterium]MBP6279586.1 cytochrome-c oxidase, cbb3-type subunit II [Rhodocyclaceae bacterium]
MLTHATIEKNVGWLVALVIVAISFGGLVEIVPLFFQKSTTVDSELVTSGLVKPYDPVRLSGRDVYLREGCYNCHSQMIRPFRAETERYGHYSVAGEFVYDHPFQWGSKRTGPDLARVGGRYSDLWQRTHLTNPRDVVPESNMPGYAFLDRPIKDADSIEEKMRALRSVGVPYTNDEIAGARKALEGVTEMDALIAYLQGMGTALKQTR